MGHLSWTLLVLEFAMTLIATLLICITIFSLFAVTFGRVELQHVDPSDGVLRQYVEKTRRWGQYALRVCASFAFACASLAA